MDTPILTPPRLQVNKWPDIMVKVWFVTATLGQWAFGLYIIGFYYVATITGDFERWNKVLPEGYKPGDWVQNLAVGTHVLLAVIMVVGGPVQFIPAIRNRFPKFHRWLGRTYIYTAIIVSSVGLFMLFTRESVGSLDMKIFNGIQAIYILTFALLTIRYAVKREMKSHRVWALRLFLVANGVWFFRVGLMAWLMIFQKPVGFDETTFTGPFLSVLALFCYALPISVILLELYLLAQKKKQYWLSVVSTFLIGTSTLYMLVGILGAIMGMWLPNVIN